MRYLVIVYTHDSVTDRNRKIGVITAKDQQQAAEIEKALYNVSQVYCEIVVRVYLGPRCKPIDVNAYELPSFMDDVGHMLQTYRNDTK
jgi:hypothetical protein